MLGVQEATQHVDALEEVWRDYIRSSFDPKLRREYCFRYFALLDALLAQTESGFASKGREEALQRVLAFECFAIEPAGPSCGPVAAGTTTLRNPCYLLAKLRAPEAPDDPQLVPLVTALGDRSQGLFYHYRQHKLCIDSENSLLLYLSASQATRQKSFHVINALEQLVGQGTDPRASERAKRIAHKVILPYLESALSFAGSRPVGIVDLELLDLGAGSGLLAARICQEIRRVLANQDMESRFRVWMVDLSLSDPGRFFAGKRLRAAVDCLTAIGSDYRHWLATRDQLPRYNGIRIGLVSRFFNNLSDFLTAAVPPSSMVRTKRDRTVDVRWRECLPSHCLGRSGVGSDALEISNARIWLDSGRTFAQRSLSQYFRGLHLLSPSGAEDVGDHDDRIFVPLRRFRPQCLLTSDGESVLERLLADCSIVLIQDADLRPQDLLAHREQMRLPGIVAIDMTKCLRLKGHYSYALARSRDRAFGSVIGERLW